MVPIAVGSAPQQSSQIASWFAHSKTFRSTFCLEPANPHQRVRGQARLKLGQYTEARVDCEAVLLVHAHSLKAL
jgi:hypothetical protein